MLTAEIYEIIKSKILLKLEDQLSPDLLYHSVNHTIDVETQAERIALNENSTTQDDILLLKIACLYHDTGFLFTFQQHEEAGCELAKKELPDFNLTPDQIDIVCSLIMATKIPQIPLTKMEEIICDADLDYLGRNDFFHISNNLFLELKARNFITTIREWNLMQIKFFNQHKYFTATNKESREQQKQKHLEMIEAMI